MGAGGIGPRAGRGADTAPRPAVLPQSISGPAPGPVSGGASSAAARQRAAAVLAPIASGWRRRAAAPQPKLLLDDFDGTHMGPAVALWRAALLGDQAGVELIEETLDSAELLHSITEMTLGMLMLAVDLAVDPTGRVVVDPGAPTPAPTTAPAPGPTTAPTPVPTTAPSAGATTGPVAHGPERVVDLALLLRRIVTDVAGPDSGPEAEPGPDSGSSSVEGAVARYLAELGRDWADQQTSPSSQPGSQSSHRPGHQPQGRRPQRHGEPGAFLITAVPPRVALSAAMALAAHLERRHGLPVERQLDGHLCHLAAAATAAAARTPGPESGPAPSPAAVPDPAPDSAPGPAPSPDPAADEELGGR